MLLEFLLLRWASWSLLSAAWAEVLEAKTLVLSKEIRQLNVAIVDFAISVLPLVALLALDPFLSICFGVLLGVQVDLNAEVTELVVLVSLRAVGTEPHELVFLNLSP